MTTMEAGARRNALIGEGMLFLVWGWTRVQILRTRTRDFYYVLGLWSLFYFFSCDVGFGYEKPLQVTESFLVSITDMFGSSLHSRGDSL